MCSPNVSDPGHGNGVSVSDPNTREIKVLASPMGATMLRGPQGMHLGNGGGALGLIFRVFFCVCGGMCGINMPCHAGLHTPLGQAAKLPRDQQSGGSHPPTQPRPVPQLPATPP